MEKIKVYVVWEKEHSRELAEEGETSFDNVETFEFDTKGEANAFLLGINCSNGWDEPYALTETNAKIEKGKIKESF